MILILNRTLQNIHLPLLTSSIVKCSILVGSKYILEGRLSDHLVTLMAMVLFYLPLLVLLCIMHIVAILIVQETELTTVKEAFVGAESLLLILALGEGRD